MNDFKISEISLCYAKYPLQNETSIASLLVNEVHPSRRINQYSVRLTTLNTCIYPVLLYGCQTWSRSESQKMSIDVCQRKTERKLLGITNRGKISNRRLQELAEAENLTQRAAWTKWRWGGHVARQQRSQLQCGIPT